MTITTPGGARAAASADIIAAVEALLPEIRNRADETAAARRLPDDLVAALRDAGAFRLPMPLTRGGPEMSLPDQLRVIEMIARADPATGWCVMIGSDAGFYSSFFDDQTALELWPDVDAITAGWLFPAGRATRVPGGYSVTGRWAFGSCCLHADVLVGGCLVVDGDGTPEMADDGLPVMRIAVAPATSFEILDTWYTTGLAGSGSNDYQCADLFVPEAHTFSLADQVRRPGPLYAMPGAFFANIHGVPLGLARRAIDEAIAVAETKLLMPQFVYMRDVPRVRDAIADAEMMLRSARAFAYSTLDAIWDELQAGRPVPTQLRADLTLSRVHSFRVARDVTMRMVQLVGTQAIYSTSVLDRLLRDAVTMGQHLVGGPVMAEAAGGLLLGVEPTGLMALLV
jgi:alkylation response protein AidB-like acyl-CoA dehydrogenase